MEGNVAREVYAEIDREWQATIPEYERLTGEPFPCVAGCADCCKAVDQTAPFIMLPIGEPEAALLRETLISLPEEVKSLLVQRQRARYSRTCLFLRDDLCLVYEGRPFWCRVFGLSGMPTCGKMKNEDRGAGPVSEQIARWSQVVHDGYARLRGASSSFVTINRLVSELERR